jgi:hypothetical protein
LRVHAQETSRRTEAKRDGVVRHHRYHQQVPERHEDDEEEERGPVAQILRGDVANRGCDSGGDAGADASWPVLLNPTGLEPQDAVEALALEEQMGHHHDRTALPGEVPDQLPEAEIGPSAGLEFRLTVPRPGAGRGSHLQEKSAAYGR